MTDSLKPDLDRFLRRLPYSPRVLAFGEPLHGPETFPRLRNEAFAHLVERHGYRSIAIESDCVGALSVDSYVNGGDEDVDHLLRTSISHGFGALAANRELLTWIREWNSGHSNPDRVSFHGLDLPTESMYAPSPRSFMIRTYSDLSTVVGAPGMPFPMSTLESLLGPDDPWSSPESMLDPTVSIGDGPEARELRILLDELLTLLVSIGPRIADLGADVHFATKLYARTSLWMLRYHAVVADRADDRIGKMFGIREAAMAETMTAIVDHESRRGPTMFYAHNTHLQRARAQWAPSEPPLNWWPAGALFASGTSVPYAVVAGDFGIFEDRGIEWPAATTIQGTLMEGTTATRLVDVESVPSPSGQRDSGPQRTGYIPLTARDLSGIDAVAFVPHLSSTRSA